MTRPWWDREDAEELAPLGRDWVRVRRGLSADAALPSGAALIVAEAEFHPPSPGGARLPPARPSWPAPWY